MYIIYKKYSLIYTKQLNSISFIQQKVILIYTTKT